MKSTLLFLISLFLILQSIAQDYQREVKYIHPADSLVLINLPELELPDSYKGEKTLLLPLELDNSSLPYFRSIFSQDGWSCGQAASIGYNFTYEINRVRNLVADTTVNLYPTHFAYNFYNDGNYSQGVCYHHTFDVLRSCGTPNVYDYGGMSNGHLHWMSDYEKYYNGMHNKIDKIYSISVADEEGLMTLKHWLNDHLTGTEYGGLANFYTDVIGVNLLPPGTPEEGKSVVTQFGNYSGHALTIIGWNDSIRWDYNEDGQYTNDIDINNDGIVNVKDWEIGGFRLANSHGENWADSGFSYVMSKVLAEEKYNGGIWNKAVHVISVKEDYIPFLTYKIELKHTSRTRLKVIAGVSSDTTDLWPEHTMEFPMFNYQGGDHYMQGVDTIESQKTIIFGLDVTPLLSFIEYNEPAKFFFQVQEYDPNNKAIGRLIYFALMDYLNGGQEIPSPVSDIPLTENGYTTLSVVHNPSYEKIIIDTEELPALISGQPYSHQLTASGGDDPYKWDLLRSYSINQYYENYPVIVGQELTPNSTLNGYVTQPIPFSFPFYGQTYDSITVHVDGFLMFNEIKYPFPYQIYDEVLFKHEPMLAVFLNQNIQIFESNQGLWYEGNEEYSAFRWVVELVNDDGVIPLDFTVFLYPDGKIEYYFQDFGNPDDYRRITGISMGDGFNYELAGFTNNVPVESQQVVSFIPKNFLSDLSIDNDGLLSTEELFESKIYDITVKVTDNNEISDRKSFQISSGIIYDYTIVSGDDNRIDPGEEPFISFTLKNIASLPITGLELNVQIFDPYITIIDDNEYIGTITPGGSINLTDAISFSVADDVPDNYNLDFDIYFNADSENWMGKLNFIAYAPILALSNPIIDDGNNGRLDPGETTDIILTLNNYGHSTAKEVLMEIDDSDPYLTLNSTSPISIGDIPRGGVVLETINITVDPEAPDGMISLLNVEVSAQPNFVILDTLRFLIGRYQLAILDLDPNQITGPVIDSLLEVLSVYHVYHQLIPANLELFQNLIVLLGRKFSKHVLTDGEGLILKDFIESGGYLYLEGGVTWFEDPQTSVHQMFNIQTQAITWHLFDTISGVNGTFTEEMEFIYSSDMLYYDHCLVPTQPAFTILHDPVDDHSFVVAMEKEGVKTIGSNIDFAGLVDSVSPSTKKELLSRILDFFEIGYIFTSAPEYEIISDNNNLNSFPNPFSKQTTINFYLQEENNIDLKLFDFFGNKISSFYTGEKLPAGIHSVSIEGDGLTNGIYFCLLKTKINISCLKIVKIN